MVTRPIYSPWEHKLPLSNNTTNLDPVPAREPGPHDKGLRSATLLEQQLRQQLARELHDGPVQTLSNVTMQLMVMQKQITADPRAAQQELSAVVASMQRAVQEMRSVMFELRPLSLEREGLVSALRDFVNHLRERHTIEINLDVPSSNLPLAPVIQTNIFYIIQEAVQNAIKHARANHLRIALNRMGDELQVFVSDDGQGFDLSQVQDGYSSRKSLGLMNLSERAQMIQGQLTLYSNLGQGTTVHLSVPTHALA
jgi:signal transduction histidine kinase